MRRLLTVFLPATALALVLWLATRGTGPIPPLGPLLDPARGAWGTARYTEFPPEDSIQILGTQGPVDVRYDRRGVPHIFASSEADAIRALGYVVARDRLFQLDLQNRAASGRLTEWAGNAALDVDQEMRRLGLTRGAEQRMAALSADSLSRQLLQAYADGINAYIDRLPKAAWPVEYRLLNSAPERWQPINSAHLINRMGWTLSLLRSEISRAEAARYVGGAAAMALFPSNSPIQEPIQPNGERGPRFDFVRIPPPGVPDTAEMDFAAALTSLAPASHTAAADDEPRWFASNNWAVSGRRSATGHPLLAGDPHLELTLPSIWYEAHLVVPGKLDVYGVTIPGLPGIVIGFNRDIAWSFTNTSADVVDLYRETVDDSVSPTNYMLDGAWKALERRVETYRGRNGEVIAIDTLYFTHRGPMTRVRGRWLSMRWTVLEGGNELVSFMAAGRARSTREFLDFMARGYFAPAQNMIVADRGGGIAIRSTGRYPLRPDGGDGLEIRDGATRASDWRGYWSVDQYPQSFDPPQGYLASANQQPIDPRHAPAYLGDDASFEAWRALRINALLRADSAVTVDEMRQFQTDPGSERANLFMPFFLRAAQAIRAAGAGTVSLDSAAAILSAWDRRYTKDNTAAILFESSLRHLVRQAWDELASGGDVPRVRPSSAIVLQLLHDSASAWWDVRATPGRVETRDVVVAGAMAAAYDSVTARLGPHAGGGWRWGNAGAARVSHLLRLPGLSPPPIEVQGGPGTLNPSTGAGFGASWRMVVQLGPAVSAMGTYPGGQSGNPASARYLDRMPLWREGMLDTLFTPQRPEELFGSAMRARLTITGGPR